MTTQRREKKSQPGEPRATDNDRALQDKMLQLAAINQNMAMIEFSIDGVFQSANELFLRVVGYSLEDLRGRHHRVMVDQAYAQSAEYASFWESLRRGETQSGEMKRVSKSGKEIWLQAIYIPISDESGKPYKVVKYASDITAAKVAAITKEDELRRASRESSRIQNALDGSTNSLMLANENFEIVYMNESLRALFKKNEAALQKVIPHFRVDTMIGSSIDIFHRNPAHQRSMLSNLRGHHKASVTIGTRLFELIAGTARNTSGEIVGFSVQWSDVTEQRAAQREVERVLDSSVKGDLTQRLNTAGFDGFMLLIGDNINRLLDSVSESFRTVKVAIEQVGQASAQLRSTSQLMSQSAAELNSNVERSSSDLSRVADSVKANAESASMANQLVSQTSTAAQGGEKKMEEMNSAMIEINQSSQKIAKIIKVIDEIAFQTNLLAINAAVEAARAGRHGKGFAVVAQEVRSLAERSAKAAKETAELIEDSTDKVGQGVKLAAHTRSALQEIVGNVTKVVDLAGEIATASGEQSSSIVSVSGSMRQASSSAQASSQQSNEVASAADELSRQMIVLKEQISKYQLPTLSAAHREMSGVPTELFEQFLRFMQGSQGGLPQRSEPQSGHTNGHTNGHSNGRTNGYTNGHANGYSNGHADPRAVLPLDRDERGFGNF